MSASALKLIAIVTMLIDHTGVELGNVFWMRVVGRMAFPIFAFFIAEGCKRTKNLDAYIIRLLSFAFLSEIFFDLFGKRGFESQNVFFTLLLGAMSIKAYEYVKQQAKPLILGYLPLMAFAYIGLYLNTDYGFMGVVCIFLAYIFNHKPLRVFMVAGVMIGLYGNIHGFYDTFYLAFSLLSCLLLLFYNGEKGFLDKSWHKWIFYVFYPAHLCLLALLFGFVLR